MANKDSQGISDGLKTGFGLAAVAAAAAGAYYFYGAKDATKNRKAMKSWMVKAKGEVMEKMEKLKEVTQDGYEQAVMQVMDKYKKIKDIDPTELSALASELQGSWKKIATHMKTVAPKTKKTISKK